MKAGGRSDVDIKKLAQSQMLAFNVDVRTKSVAVVVYQDRIEQILISGDTSEIQALKELTEETFLIYADFVEVPDSSGHQMLLCIDKSLKVHIYDIADLHRPKFELTEEEKQ